MRSLISSLATAGALLASAVLADVDPIIIKGSKFFYKTNGTQFFIQGVAYQQDVGANGTSTSGSSAYIDPLADADRCKIDIPLLAKLRTNTIRVYAVDPTKDHTACMQLLIDNNIYIVADLSQPGLSINRDTPAWNDELYLRYTSVIDMFSKYNNVIGFFAGNEVSNQQNNTGASAFVKAAVRDTKAYIKQKGYRQMYVGYATNDDDKIREDMANFFNCGNQDQAIDFWGYNIYSWCGDSSYTESGYDQQVKKFAGYSVPTFFAEYGCNTVQPRKFTEVGAIYGNQMTPVFSGGIVYMYFQQANDYGLVDASPGSAKPRSDYTALSSQMAKISPSGIQVNSYNPSNTPQACPAVATGGWQAKGSPLPPAANPDLCSCMYKSLSCVVKTGVSSENYGQLFGQVCGYGTACSGIKTDTVSGTYGAYSMCNATEQLSFAFDQYYKSQSSRADSCNFAGSANLKQSVAASGTCASLMGQAGPAGTGTVTSGSSAASGTSKKNAAGAVTVPTFDMGTFTLGVYATVASLFGVGLMLL